MVTFWGDCGGKPIARESENTVTRVLEPNAKGEPEFHRQRPFPMQTKASSELNREYKLGAAGWGLLISKQNIIRHLRESWASASLAGAVQQRVRWARLE